MKFILTALILLIACPLFGQSETDAQKILNGENTNYSINAGGGMALGMHGNSSYSIGQIFSTQVFKQIGQVDSGVQQGVDNDGVDSSIVINDSLATSIVVYPNPVSDVLFLNMGNQDYSGLVYQVFDFSGKLLMNELISEPISEIKFDYLRSGMYLFVVRRNNEFIISTKIIKE
jgi:hypothetical protein